MDRYEAIIAMTAIICGTVVIATIVSSIARAVVRTRRAVELPSGSTGRIEERLSRIEQAVDAIAVEVERVSEAQRFQSKLLSDRAGERAKLNA